MEPNDQQIIDYLLGDISEADQSAVEESLFADDDFFERLSTVENRLVDLYVLDRLTESERQAFEEKYLMSPRRRVAVESSTKFINLLEGYQRSHEPERKKWWDSVRAFLSSNNLALQTSLASLVLVFSVACIWLLAERARLKNENVAAQLALQQKEEALSQQGSNSERLAAERSALESQKLELERRQELLAKREDELRSLEARSGGQPTGRPTLVTFVLSNTIRSGAGEEELVIQPNTESVRLVAYLDPEDAEKYQVTIQSLSSNPVWNATIPKPPSKSTRLTFEIPASKFQEKSHLVKIEALTRDGQRLNSYEYSLSVKKQ